MAAVSELGTKYPPQVGVCDGYLGYWYPVAVSAGYYLRDELNASIHASSSAWFTGSLPCTVLNDFLFCLSATMVHPSWVLMLALPTGGGAGSKNGIGAPWLMLLVLIYPTKDKPGSSNGFISIPPISCRNHHQWPLSVARPLCGTPGGPSRGTGPPRGGYTDHRYPRN